MKAFAKALPAIKQQLMQGAAVNDSLKLHTIIRFAATVCKVFAFENHILCISVSVFRIKIRKCIIIALSSSMKEAPPFSLRFLRHLENACQMYS